MYDTHIDFEAVADCTYLDGRRNNMHAYSLVCKATVLLVDHFKRDTYLHHNNPGCNMLFGNHDSWESVPDDFMERFVCEEDEALFAVCVTAIKDAMRNDFLGKNRYYYFSFNLLLGGRRRKPQHFSLIVFPYLLTPDNKVWVTAYQIAPVECNASGDLKLFEVGKSCYSFDMETRRFVRDEYARKLTETEKRILKMSAEGCTETQIADYLYINTATLKKKKLALFEKMEVNTIYAAISKAFKNGDI